MSDAPKPLSVFAGMPVIWNQAHSGGYGYVIPVLARVLRTGVSKVTIRVFSEQKKQWMTRSVLPHNLADMNDQQIQRLIEIEREYPADPNGVPPPSLG